jgi:hypothetical protein
MKEVGKIVWNEWKQAIRSKKMYSVLVVAVLLLCTFVIGSYIRDNEEKEAAKTEHSLLNSEMRIQDEEEKLRNWNPNADTYEGQKRLVEDMKKNYEQEKALIDGDWRAVLEERKAEKDSLMQPAQIGRDEFVRETREMTHYLDKDVRPLGVYEMSAYDQIGYVNRHMVMLFLPLLVICIVAIVISSKTPLNRQTLLGKWIASSSLAVGFSLFFYGLFWLMLSGLYGFSTGMFEPRWINIGSIAEMASIQDQNGQPIGQKVIYLPVYESATLISNWVYTLYTVLLSSLAMIFITTIVFGCMILWRKMYIGAIVATVLISMGALINYVIWEAERKLWLFTNHLNLIEHLASRENQPAIATGIFVLTIWLAVTIVPSAYFAYKRE